MDFSRGFNLDHPNYLIQWGSAKGIVEEELKECQTTSPNNFKVRCFGGLDCHLWLGYSYNQPPRLTIISLRNAHEELSSYERQYSTLQRIFGPGEMSSPYTERYPPELIEWRVHGATISLIDVPPKIGIGVFTKIVIEPTDV